MADEALVAPQLAIAEFPQRALTLTTSQPDLLTMIEFTGVRTYVTSAALSVKFQPTYPFGLISVPALAAVGPDARVLIRSGSRAGKSKSQQSQQTGPL